MGKYIDQFAYGLGRVSSCCRLNGVFCMFWIHLLAQRYLFVCTLGTTWAGGNGKSNNGNLIDC